MNESLIKKFLKFSYGSWVGIFLGIFTTMLITRFLEPEYLGKVSMFELFLQVALIFVILGNDQAFIRFFYEEKNEKRGALFFNALRIPIVNMLIVITLIMVFYKPITFILFKESNFTMAVLLVLAIVFQMFYRFGQLVIRMQQKGNKYSLLQILNKLFYLCLIIILFFLIGNRYEVLIFSTVLATLMVLIIAIFFEKEFWSRENLSIKNVRHSQKDILKFGTPFVFTIFIAWLFEAFGKIALRQWSDFEELGLYSAALRLVALVLVLRSTFSTFWTPVAYERFESRPNDTEFFRNITIIVTFIMFIVAIISIAAKDIIVLLLGNEYQSAAKIMPFLVFMPLLYTISEATVMGINFMKKIKWHLIISAITCVVNIFLNWLLVPKFGAIGASIATAISFIIFFTLRTVVSLKYYRVKYPLIRIYIMIIVVAIYCTITINIESILNNIMLGLIALLILVVIFYKDVLYIIKNRRVLLN